MRKYRLMLSPGHSIDITPTWIEKLRNGDTNPVYRLISGLAIGVLLAGGVLFPLLAAWTRPEFGVATYLIAAVTFLLACLIIMCLMVGSQRLSDPPLFMSALVFVFMVLISLLFAPSNPKNTFGPDDAKFIGGLWVMCLLLLYYLITVFVNSGSRLRWGKLALMGGFGLATLLAVLDAGKYGSLLTVVTFAVPVLGLLAIQAKNVVISVVAGVLALVALIWSYQYTLSAIPMLAVLGALVIAGLVILSIHNWKIKFNSQKLRADVMAVIKRKKGIRTTAKANMMAVLVAAIVIWFVIIVVWTLVNKYPIGELFETSVNDYLKAANGLTDIKAMIIGNGVNASTNTTFLGIVINIQGLVGLMSYILLCASGMYLAFQNFASEIKQGGRYWWSLSLGLLVFGIPVFGLFANPGTMLAVIWWAAVGLLAAKLMWDQHGVRMYVVNTQLAVRGAILDKYLPAIQIASAVLIFIAWVYVLSIVAGLAAQGVI